MTVAALYIDPRGPYPKLLGAEYCWDAERDARTYPGPWPVVAHPPCGPWGRLRHLCRRPEDRALFGFALDSVRRFGGVLEHPYRSRAFAAHALPYPGEFPDAVGGRTIEVEQVRWGHVARKRTWLYLVGVREPREMPPPREPTHWISGGRGRSSSSNHTPVPPGLKIASAQQRRRTPDDFARWLISLAEQARRAA
jgi:hypothetical protein